MTRGKRKKAKLAQIDGSRLPSVRWHTVSAQLLRARASRAWTQEDLAWSSGLALCTVQRAEAGHAMSIETYMALCQALGLDAAALLVEASQ